MTPRTLTHWLAMLLVLVLAGAAQAATKHETAVQINLSGKQRMLTQKMTKEMLFIARGIDVEANQAALKKTATLFETTLDGLVVGNPNLGLPPTEDPAIVQQLAKVKNLWADYKKYVETALAGGLTRSMLEDIERLNMPLLKEMNKAVQMYAKAGGSKISPALANTINLAGKQRMLTQKMTKELLFIANGVHPEKNKAELQKTVALFDRTLKGLMHGDKELGLPGTKDPKILAQLQEVQKLWQQYKPILDKADVSDAALEQAARLNLLLLHEMNKAVKMFEASAG